MNNNKTILATNLEPGVSLSASLYIRLHRLHTDTIINEMKLNRQIKIHFIFYFCKQNIHKDLSKFALFGKPTNQITAHCQSYQSEHSVDYRW